MIKPLLNLVVFVLFIATTTVDASGNPLVQKDTTLSGFLIFKLISAGSLYDSDEQKVKAFNRYLDSLQRLDPGKIAVQDRLALDVYGELRKHGLLEKPFFHVMAGGKIYSVYADEAVYAKIAQFKAESLQAQNKRVRLRVRGELIKTGKLTVLHGKSVSEIQLVDGETSVEK